MNPWNQILDRIWFYLEQGPRSAGVTAAFPTASRYRYGSGEIEADPPPNAVQPVLIVDQSGGQIEMDCSQAYLRVIEEFEITVWSGSLELAKINDLRLRIVAALDSGLPNLGLANVSDVQIRMGRVSPSLDKVERDADGRLMQWRRDLQRSRQRSVLLELLVTFLIDRSTL